MVPLTEKTWCALGMALLLLLFGFTWLARPIQDPDFFWHLKMGEWLWQQHSWPIPDPFAFTTAPLFDERQLFIIKGYWLSQLTYYAFHSIFGWAGVFLLRLLTVVAFGFVLWKYRQGDKWVWSGFCLLGLMAIFETYPVERPQFFSFLLFAGLYLLLDRLWSGQSSVSWRHIFGVGLIMLLWGNLHGGVLLGQGLLLMTLALCGLGRLLRIARIVSPPSRLWLLAAVGLAASFLNPNALRNFSIVFQVTSSKGLLYATSDEYASVFSLWRGAGRELAIFYWSAAALALAGLLGGWRRQNLFTVMTVAGIGIQAGLHIRYIPFFLLAVLPVLGRANVEKHVPHIVKVGFALLAVAVTVSFAYGERNNVSLVRADGWVSKKNFPVEVASQVETMGIDGRLFNLYRWGGYLLWRLGPERQVFIDGRALDEGVMRDALTAEMVSFGGGRPVWKEIFAKHGINYAVLPVFENGRPYALTQAISRDAEWRVVSTAGNAALLLKLR